MAQWVKNPPTVQETEETWVQSLDGEDLLEEGMATHSSILAANFTFLQSPDTDSESALPFVSSL